MSNSIFIDPGALYEKAAEIAERSLLGKRDVGYGLGDIADEETLEAAFGNSLAGQMLIEGTLTGCLDALTHIPNAAVGPLRSGTTGPRGTLVNAADMIHAHAILGASLAGQLDADQRSAVVVDELRNNYSGDVARMSSIVLALVSLATEIFDNAE